MFKINAPHCCSHPNWRQQNYLYAHNCDGDGYAPPPAPPAPVLWDDDARGAHDDRDDYDDHASHGDSHDDGCAL